MDFYPLRQRYDPQVSLWWWFRERQWYLRLSLPRLCCQGVKTSKFIRLMTVGSLILTNLVSASQGDLFIVNLPTRCRLFRLKDFHGIMYWGPKSPLSSMHLFGILAFVNWYLGTLKVSGVSCWLIILFFEASLAPENSANWFTEILHFLPIVFFGFLVVTKPRYKVDSRLWLIGCIESRFSH